MRALFLSFVAFALIIGGFVFFYQSATNGAVVMPQVLAEVSPELNTELSQEQTSLVNQINAIRQDAGVNDLAYSVQLEELAKYRVEDMAIHGYYSHKSPSGQTYAAKLTEMGINAPNSCENLQLQIGNNVNDAFIALINSPAHYRCLSDPRLTRVGLSSYPHTDNVNSSSGNSQQMYVFALIIAN